MKPIFANVQGPGYYNLGDAVCSPRLYFSQWSDCPQMSISDSVSWPGDGAPVIIGGGGVFMNNFADILPEITAKRKVIIWGAGLNYPRGPVPNKLIAGLRKCALVGIRDRGFAQRYDFDYVPCASCLSPLFRELLTFKPTQQIVVYRHSWSEPFLSFPEMTNMNTTLSFAEVIQFLSSATTVITNSYHGAYWSRLLGRQVILWKPNAMRFYSGLPPLPIARDAAEVYSLLQLLPEPDQSTAEILRNTNLNYEFAKKVNDTLFEH